MALSPIPPLPAPLLTPQTYLQKYQLRFGDNDNFNISEGDLRSQAVDLADLFLAWSKLGQTLLLATLDDLATVNQRTLVVNQVARVANATDAASAGAGVEAGEREFLLRPDSQGPLWAYTTMAATTRVRVRWLPIGEPDEEFLPFLQLEDSPHAAGDAVKYTFPNGQTIPLQVRRAIPRPGAGAMNPVPTGEDDDPNYLPLAPLVSPLPTGGAGLTAQAFVDLIHPESPINAQVAANMILQSFAAASVGSDHIRNENVLPRHLSLELQGGLQLSAYARCIVVTSVGVRVPYDDFLGACSEMDAGDVVHVFGFHTYGNASVSLPSGATLCLAAGAHLQLREVYGPNNGSFTILGPGTLEALISPGPRTYKTLVQQLHLVGRLNPFAYNQDYNAVRLVRVTDCTIEAGNNPALTAQYGYGGYYRSLVRCEFTSNRISTSAAAVFQLYDSLLGNAADPAAEAGNALQLINNIISAPAATADKVVDATQGVFTYEQGNNIFLGTAAPTKAGSSSVVVFPGGSAGTAPKPSAPVLQTQDDELNRMEWTKDSTITPGGYEVSMDGGDSAATITSAQVVDGKIRIAVPSGHVGVGIIGLRKRATASAPASDWTFNTVAFTPVELFLNSSFDNALTNWTAGPEVSSSNGQAVFAGNSLGGQNNLGQAPQNQVVGKRYRIRAYGSLTSGTPRMLTDSGGNEGGKNFPPFVDGYTEVIITLASADGFYINGGGCVGLKLDRFSFTEE